MLTRARGSSVLSLGFAFVLALSMLAAAPDAAAQCVSLTTLGSATTQNFDTLSNTAGSTTNNLTITGWFMTETGGGARDNEQYAVDTGSSNTGDTYSYGSTGATDRALGALQSGTLISTIGACFVNNTGATILQLDIAYTGEQWRIGNVAAARDDRLDFQFSTDATSLTTGTWTDVNSLDFINPIKTAGVAGSLDGNLAANRATPSANIPTVVIANGATVWIRWNDFNASGADDGLTVDTFSLTPQGGVVLPQLTVTDVSQAETNAGTTTFTFQVNLSAPAGPGGVTFDIATADGTAQDDNPATEDNDYVAQSLTGQVIAAGNSSLAFNVNVNGDIAPELSETFFVNVTNVTGAAVTDGQGQGTIVNDDYTPIHDIQGNGGSSPLSGSVTTRGIVTGRKSNGFFIQEPDASVDADPLTSEGLFVFTSAAPPAAATVGNLVEVTGTIAEFVPSSDLLQPPLTELTSPTTVQLSTGNPLPAAIPLTPGFPDPAGPFDQLERLEAMRVSVASLTTSSPTLGNAVDEPNATQSSNGVFFGTVTGVARPAREPGIQDPDPAPSGGTIPPIPRFDTNPEVLRIDSDGLTGAPILDVDTGATVTGLVGPLDYGFRRYILLPDPTLPAPVPAGGNSATAASVATAAEFTVATYNVQRFFNDVDDPGIGEPVLTSTAYNNRLNKISLGIRNHLLMPDVIGMVEVENLSTLSDIATRVNNDAVAASQPNPQYTAHLVEGNDVGGIDVGLLVKTAVVVGATPRVTVNAVVQENAGELFVNPDSSTELLNDRPTLRLDAVINSASGSTFPVQILANHLRSLLGANDESAGPNGWPTVGSRIRAKRQKQAESLANLIQTRQTADPAERIIVVGDFNAFEFNDGLADTMNVIAGTPPPDNETAVPGDGVDLVNPDLDNLFDTPAAGERYSYVNDGQIQNLDHVLMNGALTAATTARRIEHARINADFRAIDRNDANTARHVSDHDPIVAYFAVGSPGTFEFSAANYDVGEATTTFNVTVTRTGGSFGAADVSYTIAAGTAQAADFTAGSGTISYADGQTSQTFQVTIVNDAIDEPDQTIALSLSNPTNGASLGVQSTATITIQDDDAAPTITIDDLLHTEGNSGTTQATLTATLSGTTEFVVDLSWTLDAGTAACCGVDFSGPNGTLTFPVGTTTRNISATIFGETIYETDETVLVNLTVATNATIADTQGVITIVNDDAVPTITISDLMHTEGDSGTTQATLVATLNGATEIPVDLSWTLDAGTASCCGVDFSGPNGTTTFLPGQTTKNISATIFGDTIDEPNETVLVNLTTASNATIADNQGVITIVDDDGTPQLVINDLSVAEGNSGTSQVSLTVTLVGSTAQTVTVDWTLDAGTATCCGNDFSGPNGTLNFPVGITTRTISATIFGDLRYETNETILVNLTNATNATIADNQGVFTITNDDAAPVFTIGDASLVEGNAGTANAIVTVTKTGATDLAASVDFATAPGSATAGSDYTHITGSLTFPAATTTLQINVPILGDTTVEPDETVQVNLSNAVDATLGDTQALVTILNDDVMPLPSVTGTKSVSGSFVPGGNVTYTIVLTNAGNAAQGDNPGNEFIDVLPSSLQLVSASATSGTAVATIGTNTVTWNGAIAAGASVTITINATIPTTVSSGTSIVNQGTINTDANGDGSNETALPTDDANQGGAADATGFVVGIGAPNVIPTMGEWGRLLLALALMLMAFGAMRRKAMTWV